MRFKDIFLIGVGAAIGGVLGYWAFFWIARQGFYGLILPGGLLGVGAGLSKGKTSLVISVICGLSALALGLFTEWRFAPFVKDKSLVYFLAHALELRPVTVIMIAAGAFLGFWVPFRRSQEAGRT